MSFSKYGRSWNEGQGCLFRFHLGTCSAQASPELGTWTWRGLALHVPKSPAQPSHVRALGGLALRPHTTRLGPTPTRSRGSSDLGSESRRHSIWLGGLGSISPDLEPCPQPPSTLCRAQCGRKQVAAGPAGQEGPSQLSPGCPGQQDPVGPAGKLTWHSPPPRPLEVRPGPWGAQGNPQESQGMCQTPGSQPLLPGTHSPRPGSCGKHSLPHRAALWGTQPGLG